MAQPQSSNEEFTAAWQKATAWAESQGITASAYLPVYQMDLTRVQHGEYPMSASERNREILAAHTPSQVTPSTSTSPSPTNVLHNAMNTARNLFTGLIHLPEELWHSADTTLHAIENPASLNGKTAGATLGNWLNDTLLSFIPGASDLGTILQKGVGAGLETLAEHPILSGLDLLPGEDGGFLKKLSHSGEISEDVVRKSLLGRLANKVGDVPTNKAGVTMQGAAKTQLTVSDRLQQLAARVGPGGSGVGPELSNLGAFVQNASMLRQNLYSWLFDAPARVMSEMDDTQKAQLRDILDTRQTDGGDRVRAALADPNLSPLVKEALVANLDGPLRFATEEALFAGGLHAVQTVEGRIRYYSKPAIASIDKAWHEAEAGRRKALETITTGPFAEHVQHVAQLNQMLPQALQRFMGGVQQARTAVAQDAGLLDNATQDIANPSKFRAKRGISKSAQVQAVIGEGGLADDLVRQIRKDHDPAQVKALADAMKSRLSKWGPKSVDATEVPALADLHQMVDAFSQWADEYTKETRAIDHEIHGELAAQRYFRDERGRYGGQQMDTLKTRQKVERDNVAERFTRARSKARGDFAMRLKRLKDTQDLLIGQMVDRAEGDAKHLTGKAVDRDVMPKLNLDIAKTRRLAAKAMKDERQSYLAQDAVRRAERQRDIARMARRHEEERTALKKEIGTVKAGMGEVVRELQGWADAVDGYHQAIADHPADQFRDAMMTLFEQHLMKHEQSAMLVEQTAKYLEKNAPSKVAELRNDPKLLGEYMVFRFHDIYEDPRLDPEVAADARRAANQAWKSADAELKTLIAQGFEVPYIPASTTADVLLGRDAIKPLIGRGIPKPDIDKAKVWDATPQTGDFAVGINKAVVQALQRDATIEVMEHYVRPMAMTGKELREFIDKVAGPGVGLQGGAGVGRLSQAALDYARNDLKLKTIDTQALFGFTLPRWGKDELWLPAPLVNAMQQLADERRRMLAGVTKVFRYSILGLSPRYDAHVIFGGAVMAAFRSTPLMPTFVGQAWRALRDGTLPEIPGHSAVEEGFQQTVFRIWHEQGGQQIGKMAIAEHMEVVQKIARGAAKPVHWLKAVGDLNFRFTRYVRDLQTAVVYLDGAAKATRQMAKIAIEDPETGRTVELTARRAMEAGMRHVEQVYGNLGKMSPFERQVAQTIMPFYGWQKHILSYVLRFPFDHPWRALVLSQLADRASEQVPASWPVRLQLLFFLGSPSSSGTVDAIDVRSLDPFRTTANYFSLTGWIESLNPALLAPVAMVDPQIIYGENVLYPGLSYTAFYGSEQAGATGNLVTGISQVIPQVSAITSALSSIGSVRSTWSTDPSSAIKSLLSNLNIPFVTPPVNLRQISAHSEGARYQAAKTLAYQAFQTGTFKAISSYKSVPNPLNPDYTITPKALEALWQLAKQQTPTLPPIESLLPPPTPFGY